MASVSNQSSQNTSSLDSMHEYHDADALLQQPGLMRDARKLKAKARHSVAVTDSAQKAARTLCRTEVSEKVASAAKKLFEGDDRSPVSFEAEPGIEVTVLDPDTVQVRHTETARRRTFGHHTTPKGKRIFPIEGDGILTAEEGSRLTPNHLLEIAKKYRKSPTGKPKEFLVEEAGKLGAKVT